MKKLFSILCLLVFLLPLTHAEETAPENFGALIRYNFLRSSHQRGVRGSKEWQCEDLPPSQIERDRVYGLIRVIRGYVSQLPYHFIIKVIKMGPTDPGTIEADIVDPVTNKSIKGYPHQIPNTMRTTDDVTDQIAAFYFEIPKPLKDQLLKKYLTLPGHSKPDGIFVEALIKMGIGSYFFDEIKDYKSTNP